MPTSTPLSTTSQAVPSARREWPNYLGVFLTFARNSLIRDMTFRANFLIEAVTTMAWMGMNLAFYLLIFSYSPTIGVATGWSKFPFLVFFATTLIINAMVQAFFMPNVDEFSELIRSGNLDFALLKPIDTQFLISLHRIEWSTLANLGFGLVLLGYALWQLDVRPTWYAAALYPLYIGCGVAILYSLMIVVGALSVWLGRNQSLYDVWFYVTNFSRYPMEIYQGRWGTPLRQLFTFAIPVLVVTNVPARLLAKPLDPSEWRLTGFALLATLGSLVASRWVFERSLYAYRSASS